LSCGTACRSPLAFGVQPVLFVDVAVVGGELDVELVMELDVAAGVVQVVVWDGVQVAA